MKKSIKELEELIVETKEKLKKLETSLPLFECQNCGKIQTEKEGVFMKVRGNIPPKMSGKNVALVGANAKKLLITNWLHILLIFCLTTNQGRL